MDDDHKVAAEDIGVDIGGTQSRFDEYEFAGIYSWGGQIKLVNEESIDEHGEEPVIGGVSAWTIVPSRLLSSLTDSLDAVSGDLFTIAEAIPDADEPFLILDQMHLDEEYRGQGLGLVVAELVIRRLGIGCAFAVTYPAPPGDTGVWVLDPLPS